MRFTSEEAYEAHEAGEPIMMTREATRNMIREHGLSYHDFMDETFGHDSLSRPAYDAWTVLSWLGY